MKKLIKLLFLSLFISSYANAADGVISIQSKHSVKDTADKFAAIVESKGLSLFTRIDHQKNAAGVDLVLTDTEVLIFGNPKVGTPLMQCAPTMAIDLPQKVLVWKDANNTVWLSYNDPEYLKQRHDIQGCDEVVKKVSNVLSALTAAAAK